MDMGMIYLTHNHISIKSVEKIVGLLELNYWAFYFTWHILVLV